MKFLTFLSVGFLVIVGLALIAPGAVMWQALQIQAGLGNTAPLMTAAFKMAGGLVCMGLAWWLLNQKN